ncbi:hypothetical protein [Cryptosporangium phraense]|uniref:Uncharacterized protein n=1 Tax=Cryptosporangium phraense TaxID=2593070 RepID=A0A545AKJ9_9ACTN|nr:hypothetical protein [Cryptosporangium phraense]TQS41857.1 hypothetical protein FL583_27930 [Cryptosporangium phraense]
MNRFTAPVAEPAEPAEPAAPSEPDRSDPAEATSGRRLLWGVDADAVATLCSMRIEIPSELLRPTGSAFTGHDAVADTAVIHRLTVITPAVGLELPADRVDDAAELAAHAADADIRIGAVVPDVAARPGRPLPLCHPDADLAQRALLTLRRAAALAVDLDARRFVVRLHTGAPYPGAGETQRRLDRLADVLSGVRRQLPASMQLVVEYSVDDPFPVRRATPDWQTASWLAAAAGPGTKVLLDPVPVADEDPELSITTLRAADRLAGLRLGAAGPFALFLAMVDAAEGGVLVRGRRCPVPFALRLPPGERPGIETALRTVAAVQEAAAKAMLLDRAALRAAQAVGDVEAATEVLLTAYETDASPLLTAVRAALGGPADTLAAYRELCRDTHRAVERQRSLLRAALRLGAEPPEVGSDDRIGAGPPGGRVVGAGLWGLRGVG